MVQTINYSVNNNYNTINDDDNLTFCLRLEVNIKFYWGKPSFHVLTHLKAL